MSPRKQIDNKKDSSVIDDDEELLEQAVEIQFHEHPDYHIIELYENDDSLEWD